MDIFEEKKFGDLQKSPLFHEIGYYDTNFEISLSYISNFAQINVDILEHSFIESRKFEVYSHVCTWNV